jgi:drug/metabolite transporter (DMT)-like permease
MVVRHDDGVMATATTIERLPATSTHLSLTSARRAWQPSTAAASVLVATAACAFAFVAFFARGLAEAGLASASVAFYRYGLAAVITARFLALGPAKRRATAWAMASGLGMGLGWIAYVEAIRTIEVATVGVIYMTYPLFTLGAAWLLFGLRPTGRAVMACVLIAAAAVGALSPAAVGTGDPAMLFVAV